MPNAARTVARRIAGIGSSPAVAPPSTQIQAQKRTKQQHRDHRPPHLAVTLTTPEQQTEQRRPQRETTEEPHRQQTRRGSRRTKRAVAQHHAHRHRIGPHRGQPHAHTADPEPRPGLRASRAHTVDRQRRKQAGIARPASGFRPSCVRPVGSAAHAPGSPSTQIPLPANPLAPQACPGRGHRPQDK